MYRMPGHTPGTISGIFQVHDHGKPLTIAYSGGTEFNFVNDVPHFDTYLASERKFAAIAASAGATYWETSLSSIVRLPSSGRWPIGGPARRIHSKSAPPPLCAISKLKMNARKRCASSCSPSSTMPPSRSSKAQNNADRGGCRLPQ